MSPTHYLYHCNLVKNHLALSKKYNNMLLQWNHGCKWSISLDMGLMLTLLREYRSAVVINIQPGKWLFDPTSGTPSLWRSSSWRRPGILRLSKLLIPMSGSCVARPTNKTISCVGKLSDLTWAWHWWETVDKTVVFDPRRFHGLTDWCGKDEEQWLDTWAFHLDSTDCRLRLGVEWLAGRPGDWTLTWDWADIFLNTDVVHYLELTGCQLWLHHHHSCLHDRLPR